MAGGLEWTGPKARARTRAELTRRANVAGALHVVRTRGLASRPGTPRLRSRRGESPRRQTGRLVRSIRQVVVVEPKRRIGFAYGSRLVYALPLEEKLNRPYITRAFEQLLPTTIAILTRG